MYVFCLGAIPEEKMLAKRTLFCVGLSGRIQEFRVEGQGKCNRLLYVNDPQL